VIGDHEPPPSPGTPGWWQLKHRKRERELTLVPELTNTLTLPEHPPRPETVQLARRWLVEEVVDPRLPASPPWSACLR
jgi:hypothetical protein